MATFTCLACAQPTERDTSGPRRFCSACGIDHLNECWRAIAAVGRAVKRGDLPRADTQVCRDCGKPARFYDHRDYLKPLDVEPVCISCNCRRGPAFDSKYRPQTCAA